LKTGEGSLKDIMADEEGASGKSVASADDSGLCPFLYVINGIFLVGERVVTIRSPSGPSG
jgi:hypothetical protein